MNTEEFSSHANQISIDWRTGLLAGNGFETAIKTFGEIRSIFHDQEAARQIAPEREAYRVQYFMPIAEGTEGGLFWGNTTLQPGKVGDEYFMTKGHFHRIRNRGEYYATVHGEGALILMEESGATRYETMSPGSLHFIPGCTAHRVANTGATELVFTACWPSDAGHDYETIEREGFRARLLERNGQPVLIPAESIL